MPDINPAKVCHIVVKAREIDAQEPAEAEDEGSNAIDEGFQDILLDVEVVIVDLRQRFLESRQIFDGFVDAVIVDVVARGLGPQDDVITNVLLDEAVAIVAANLRVG